MSDKTFKDIYKIEFRYNYIESPEGNYKNFIYTNKLPDTKQGMVDLINNYIEETDKAMIFKSIVDVYTFNNRYIEV